MAMTPDVTLTGQLVCATEAEMALVVEHLPLHVELTRAEPGCISFEVVPTADPAVWQVDERFVDAAAYEEHQRRAAASAWGVVTTGIARNYTVRGLPD